MRKAGNTQVGANWSQNHQTEICMSNPNMSHQIRTNGHFPSFSLLSVYYSSAPQNVKWASVGIYLHNTSPALAVAKEDQLNIKHGRMW